MTGINSAGVAFYQTSFDLEIPSGYDVPLSFYFGNTTINRATADYQAQPWINGYVNLHHTKACRSDFNLSVGKLHVNLYTPSHQYTNNGSQ